ncbi:MAG: c-type cytochrome [Ginsengibacter sp.]
MKKYFFIGGIFLLIIFLVLITDTYFVKRNEIKNSSKPIVKEVEWAAPDTLLIPATKEGDLIRYGRELILNTSRFLGPAGKVVHISNGMNCNNCHLEAGTRILGNNFSMVAVTYPLYRNRSGKMESVEMRINDCFERSLNGEKLADTSREMRAMISYMNWLGQGVIKGSKTAGSGSEKLPFMKRPADTAKGKIVYLNHCQRCHGKNGEGQPGDSYGEYLYPPLWGKNSFNVGAGLYQLSKFSGYIKNNMPFGTTYKSAVLTDEQAWDVAAYVNSQPRPLMDLKMDWPDISTKPFDYPMGPYADRFSESRHKYGPYQDIVQTEKKSTK